MKQIKRLFALLLCLCLCTAYFPGTLVSAADTVDVPKITLSSVIAEPDEDVVIAVDLAENPGLMAMLFGITYDHNLLTFNGQEDAGLTGWDRNEDRILWLGEEDSTFNGTIVKLNFHVSPSAGAGDIAVSLTCGSEDVGNHDEDSFLPEITAGKVHIHGWGDPTYTWADDNSSVTAQRVCSVDAEHVETETVQTVSQITKPATCEGKGETTWTATFTNPAFATQTKTEANIQPLGHSYALTGWSWTGYTAATATFTCTNDANHVQTVDATITNVRYEPTCEADGKIVYTATVSFEGRTYTDTKTETLMATGHDYELSGWSWTGYTAASAIFICKNDLSHVQTVDATITSVRTEPSSEENGSVVYTAKVNFEGSEYSDTKTEVLPALGHEYELSGWNWTGYTVATATFTDKNGGPPITVDALIAIDRTEPTCEQAGQVVYTATVTLSGATYTDIKTETLPALGHIWGEPSYVWADDNSSVTASRVCQRDESHVETETAAASSEITKPATCEGKGETTYTAVFTNPAFATQTKTVEDIEPLGHDYELTGWSWTGYTAATATFTCQNNASHTQTVAATITSKRTEPTCEAEGKVVYTASVSFEGKTYIDAKTETIPALGHDWNEPTYVWATDYSTVSASRSCKNDASHVETETVNTSSKVTKEATETAEGEITYTAVFTNPAFEKQTKAVVIPKLEKPELTNPFVDVIKGAFYYDAVLWAVNAKPQVTSGTSPTTFSPNSTCTRGQVVTFLWRAKGSPAPKLTENPFEDVEAKGFYYKAVLWAVENNITAGLSKTTFGPNVGCTRGQVVTFLWRTQGKPNPKSTESPFTDVDTKGFYYKAMCWAVENKITTGTSKTTFAPENTCTRGQIVTFLYRAVAN